MASSVGIYSVWISTIIEEKFSDACLSFLSREMKRRHPIVVPVVNIQLAVNQIKNMRNVLFHRGIVKWSSAIRINSRSFVSLGIFFRHRSYEA